MSFEVSGQIFVHDFLNPPTEDRSCNIDLNVINSTGVLTLQKVSPGIQTKYNLNISNSSSIWLTSIDQTCINYRLKDLIVAINLSLRRTCLSIVQSNYPTTDISFEPSDTKVKIEQTKNGKIVSIIETIRIRDSVHIEIGTQENIDENSSLNYIEKIIKINRFNITKTTHESHVNISKSINEYENAMMSFNRLRIFKNLFNSLELSTNWDGVDRRGTILDSEISSISLIPQKDIEYWRGLYNRTKHIDRTPTESSDYVEGVEKLTTILPTMREASSKLLINRLNRI